MSLDCLPRCLILFHNRLWLIFPQFFRTVETTPREISIRQLYISTVCGRAIFCTARGRIPAVQARLIHLLWARLRSVQGKHSLLQRGWKKHTKIRYLKTSVLMMRYPLSVFEPRTVANHDSLPTLRSVLPILLLLFSPAITEPLGVRVLAQIRHKHTSGRQRKKKCPIYARCLFVVSPVYYSIHRASLNGGIQPFCTGSTLPPLLVSKSFLGISLAIAQSTSFRAVQLLYISSSVRLLQFRPH